MFSSFSSSFSSSLAKKTLIITWPPVSSDHIDYTISDDIIHGFVDLAISRCPDIVRYRAGTHISHAHCLWPQTAFTATVTQTHIGQHGAHNWTDDADPPHCRAPWWSAAWMVVCGSWRRFDFNAVAFSLCDIMVLFSKAAVFL